jgi:peptide/nickel transport system substrate-binding protein
MNLKRHLSRREFIRMAVLFSSGAVVAACGPVSGPGGVPQTNPTQPGVVQATPTSAYKTSMFREPPMLAALVKEGKLPPIDKRLPETPLIFSTLEVVGKHGGSIRRAYKGLSDRTGPTKVGDRCLVWFDRNLINRPRLAESWTVNPAGTEWIFKLRKGTRWSDGKELTSQDVKWWYDNVLTNKTVTPSPASMWTTGSKKTVMALEIMDNYTFKFKFADPNPLFILKIGRTGYEAPMVPSHYMKQWHMDTTDDKAGLEQKAKEAGAASWDRYYIDNRNWWYLNPERPSLAPWLPTEPIGKDLFVMTRNPYFFGVDKEGQQLPYFDQVSHRLFQETDVFDIWVTNGAIDFQQRHVDAGKFTLYKESEKKGDYTIYVGVNANHLALQPNQTTKNEKLREFFQSRNVRIAMSLAINRDLINKTIYTGMAKPRQYSPISASPQYYKKLSEAYIQYDVDQANKLLDEAGYKAKNADGFRKWKDGSAPISFTIESTDADKTPTTDACQMVIEMFAKVGIQCTYKYAERADYEKHYKANDIEAAWWGGDRTVLPLAPEATVFRGIQPDRPWAQGYGIWKVNPSDPNGIQPPADHYINKIWDLWDKIAVEVNPENQNKLFQQILDIWAEELPMIGVLGELPAFCIVKNGIHNFINNFPSDDTTGDEHIYNTETYTWDDPEKHKL